MMSQADLVWNRAALEQGGRNPLAGDRHIVALIALHSVLMNGGLEHAMDSLTSNEFQAGVAGFRFLGMNDVAHVLESAAASTSVESFEDEYLRLVPDDACIADSFERVFADSPELFGLL